MIYVVQVITYIRSKEGRLNKYKTSYNAWSYAEAKQMETELTNGSEVNEKRMCWQEANICASTRIGRNEERVLIPLNEVQDLIKELTKFWDQAMTERLVLGAIHKVEQNYRNMPTPPSKYEDGNEQMAASI